MIMVKQRIARELSNGKIAVLFSSDGDKQIFSEIGDDTHDDNWIAFVKDNNNCLVNLNHISQVEFHDDPPDWLM